MLDLTKEFLRIDGNFEDNLIESLMLSAQSYLYNATGKQFDKANETHKLIVLLLTTHFYENRNITETDNIDNMLKSMLLQVELEDDNND